MSCMQLNGSNFDKSVYFGFRVGAYNQGRGVGLSSDFKNQTVNFAPDLKKTALSTAAINVGAQPVLAMRYRNNLQSVYVNPLAGGAAEGIDHSTMLVPLSDDSVTNKFVADPTTLIRYINNGTALGARTEGDLNLNFGIQGLNDMKVHLQSDAMLTVTYPVNAAKDVMTTRAPAYYFSNYPMNSASTQIYGRGLALQFRTAPGATGNTQSWVLGNVADENLAVAPNDPTRVTGGFSCPNNLVFRVVDHKDVNPTPVDSYQINCRMQPDDYASLSASDQNALRRARLTLRVEDWWIDMANKCIVPKKWGQGVPACYGSSGVKVEYDLSKPCVDSPMTTANRACAAFASICVR